MALRDDIPKLLEHWKANRDFLKVNSILFDIYEGDLARYVLDDLRRQVGPESFQFIKHRIAPINTLKKIVDKLSKIYGAVYRDVSEGSESEKELLTWYEDNMAANPTLNLANEFFNTFKSTLIQPYLDDGLPKLRNIPSHIFLPYSDDPVDPTRMTHLMILMDVEKTNGREVNVFHVYTDDEFLIVDSDGDVRTDAMRELDNFDGDNPIGRIPFVYVNRSANLLVPKADSDTLAMTKLIPILLSDLNFASMFNSFSILYMIGVTPENLKRAPNAIWTFKPDIVGDQKPEIGTIKPEADITETLTLIQAELAMWLNSKGIRPGQLAGMSTETIASGISKMIDEGDTYDERRKQIQYFIDAEADLWDLIFNGLHPMWVDRGLIENTARMDPNKTVLTVFADPKPVANRTEVVQTQKEEIDAGFTTRSRAIKTLNPGMTDAEVDQLIAEIDAEKTLKLPATMVDEPNEDDGDGSTEG